MVWCDCGLYIFSTAGSDNSSDCNHSSHYFFTACCRFPLYSRGVDRTRFEYGVFLLNKNIEQVFIVAADATVCVHAI